MENYPNNQNNYEHTEPRNNIDPSDRSNNFSILLSNKVFSNTPQARHNCCLRLL